MMRALKRTLEGEVTQGSKQRGDDQVFSLLGPILSLCEVRDLPVLSCQPGLPLAPLWAHLQGFPSPVSTAATEDPSPIRVVGKWQRVLLGLWASSPPREPGAAAFGPTSAAFCLLFFCFSSRGGRTLPAILCWFYSWGATIGTFIRTPKGTWK